MTLFAQLAVMVNPNGLSCKKRSGYLNPMEIDFMMTQFLAFQKILECVQYVSKMLLKALTWVLTGGNVMRHVVTEGHWYENSYWWWYSPLVYSTYD